MENPSGGRILLTTVAVMAVMMLCAYGIRSCAASSNEDAHAARIVAEVEREETLRFYRVAQRAETGPETAYLGQLRMVRDELKAKGMKGMVKPSYVMELVESLRNSDPGTQFITKDVPVADALLLNMATDPFHAAIKKRWNNTLDRIVLEYTGVPVEFTKAAPPVEPFEFWDRASWFWNWVIASLLFLPALFIFENIISNRKELIFLVLPWKSVGGVLAAVIVAPAVIVIAVPLHTARFVIQAAKADWSIFARRSLKSARVAAYRLRLLRKLPAPDPARFRTEGPGTLTVAPATAANVAVPAPAPRETAPARARERNGRPDGGQWFAFHSALLHGWHDAIESAGLRPVTLDITEPFEGRVCALPRSEMDRFEQVVGLTDSKVTYQETDIQSMFLCGFACQSGTVRVSCHEAEHDVRITGMLQRVSSQSGGIDITFDGHADCVPDPAPRCSGITVLHCVRPSAIKSSREVTRVFGKDFPNGVTVINPVEGRGKVITDKDGVVVGQVIGRVLCTYVHGILSAKAGWANEALMRVIIEAIGHLEAAETASSAVADVWRRDLESRKKEYVRMASRRFEAEARELEKSTAEFVAAADVTRRELSSIVRQRKSQERRLEEIRTHTRDELERGLAAEFDQLAASEFVERAECADGHVEIYTKPVRIDHGTRRFEIGKFRIRLAENGHIDIANVASTSRSTRWHHPHVAHDRAPCFGNVQESLAQCLANRQFAVAAGFVWRFLGQYNPHNGVADIAHWKEVPND